MHVDLRLRGGTLLALSADTPAQARTLQQDLQLEFPVVGEPDLAIAGAFGLLHERGGPGRRNAALPAHVLLGQGGEILWRHVASRIQDRPAPADLRETLARILPAR